MALTIRTEEDEQRQLKMHIEVPEARVQQEMQKTARKLARDVHIPGFRRGKAPYRVIVRRFGEDVLRAEVVEEMVQSVFEEALEQTETEIYAPPRLEGMELEPLVYTFTVPLTPQLKLGDYRQIRKEIEPVEISEEAIDEAMEQVRARYQVLEDVDRPVQVSDLVSLGGRGVVVGQAEAGELMGDGDVVGDEDVAVKESETADDGGEAGAGTAQLDESADEQSESGAEPEEEVSDSGIIFDEEKIEFLMDPEKLFPGTPFVENLLGMSAGDEKSFGFVFPEDFEDEDLAGKEASFSITVLNVQQRDLPEMNDELAQQEGNFQTVAELRDSLSNELKQQATSRAKNELIEGMIDDLMVDAELVYPPAAVELEVDSMVESFKNRITRSGWKWEDFMKLRGDTEEKLRTEFQEQAKVNVERRLILRQFVVEEKLKVEEDDIEAAVTERVSRFEDNEELKESMAGYFRSGYGFDLISSEVLMDKVYERMAAIFGGNAPDLASLEDEAAVNDEEE